MAREMKQLVAPWDTAGLRFAGARRAYQAARRDWAALPTPVFEELAATGIRLMNEGVWDRSLSQFIESSVRDQLGWHVVVETRGRRIAVRALTAAGRAAMAAVLAQGVALTADVRRTLTAFLLAVPEALVDPEALERRFAA